MPVGRSAVRAIIAWDMTVTTHYRASPTGALCDTWRQEEPRVLKALHSRRTGDEQ